MGGSHLRALCAGVAVASKLNWARRWRGAGSGAGSSLEAQKLDAAPIRDAQEPKAPHEPAGRVEASPSGASVAAGPEAPPLDTLAQLDQDKASEARKRLKKRARAKHITVPMAVRLAELRTPLEKSYRNSVYCAGQLVQDGTGKLTGKYCGARWCLVCCRGRTARAIHSYMPVLTQWKDSHFVTLTLPNVPGEALSETIGEMLSAIKAIGRAVKRTDRLPFHALRKLECTVNPQRMDFHPHFHLVVEGRESAEAVRRRWLQRYPRASPKAQDIRQCNEGSLKEMFKYFTKLVVTRGEGTAPRSFAPIPALDVVFRAMKGRRVFQPMGFRVARQSQNESEEIGAFGDTPSPVRHGEAIMWEWAQDLHDWIDFETGEALSGFDPALPAF